MSDKTLLNPALINGRAHLSFVSLAERETRQVSDKSLSEGIDLDVIGTSMCIFYQAATCYRKCNGGPHILESLIGRSYNLTCAAYILILRGFYDEAMNLIRSLGEIANLLMLTFTDRTATHDWLSSTKKDRLRKFSPSAIRKRLKQLGRPLVATDSWYEEFCEQFTHVTPQTRPNRHNKSITGVAGGVFQNEGLSKSLDELAAISGSLALLVSHTFSFKDLFDALSNTIDKAKIRPIRRKQNEKNNGVRS